MHPNTKIKLEDECLSSIKVRMNMRNTSTVCYKIRERGRYRGQKQRIDGEVTKSAKVKGKRKERIKNKKRLKSYRGL